MKKLIITFSLLVVVLLIIILIPSTQASALNSGGYINQDLDKQYSYASVDIYYDSPHDIEIFTDNVFSIEYIILDYNYFQYYYSTEFNVFGYDWDIDYGVDNNAFMELSIIYNHFYEVDNGVVTVCTYIELYSCTYDLDGSTFETAFNHTYYFDPYEFDDYLEDGISTYFMSFDDDCSINLYQFWGGSPLASAETFEFDFITDFDICFGFYCDDFYDDIVCSAYDYISIYNTFYNNYYYLDHLLYELTDSNVAGDDLGFYFPESINNNKDNYYDFLCLDYLDYYISEFESEAIRYITLYKELISTSDLFLSYFDVYDSSYFPDLNSRFYEYDELDDVVYYLKAYFTEYCKSVGSYVELYEYIYDDLGMLADRVLAEYEDMYDYIYSGIYTIDEIDSEFDEMNNTYLSYKEKLAYHEGYKSGLIEGYFNGFTNAVDNFSTNRNPYLTKYYIDDIVVSIPFSEGNFNFKLKDDSYPDVLTGGIDYSLFIDIYFKKDIDYLLQHLEPIDVTVDDVKQFNFFYSNSFINVTVNLKDFYPVFFYQYQFSSNFVGSNSYLRYKTKTNYHYWKELPFDQFENTTISYDLNSDYFNWLDDISDVANIQFYWSVNTSYINDGSLTNCGVSSKPVSNTYNDGYSSGYSYGFNEGKDIGYNLGYDVGNKAGEEVGYTNGYKDGNKAGYNEGLNVGASQNINLGTLFWNIGTIPFETFKTIWDFEFLGINLSGFIGGLLLSLVAIFIIKKVLL